MSMIIGFSGTRRGMTHVQRSTLRYLFNELRITELHHGDCIGADAQAHAVARQYNVRIVVHPPSDASRRAFCPDYVRQELPQPYLLRNKAIVDASHGGLIAAPGIELRSGTWSTVRYARQRGVRIWLLRHDGTWHEETTQCPTS